MEPHRLWNRRFVLLLAIEGLLQMGGFLTRPIISNYAVSLGASVPVSGFLAGMLATGALAIRPVSGFIADRLSKRTLLLAACTLFAVGALGCALCHSVVLVGFFLALQGFAFAFKSTIIISLIPFIVPQQRIGAAVGWMGLAYTVAVALGPAIGSEVGVWLGYSASFLASAALLFGALGLTMLFKFPSSRDGGGGQLEDEGSESEKAALHHGRRQGIRAFLSRYLYLPTIPIALVAGLLMIAQGITSSFILLASQMRGIEAASLYFVCYSLATLGARPLAGRASDSFGVAKVAPPMMIVAALGMVALALLDSVAGIVIGGVLMGCGQGSAYAAIQSESVRGVPEDMLGRSSNTFFIGPDICMGLGPVAGGAILQSQGPEAMFLFNAVAIVGSLVLFLGIQWAKRKAR